MSKIVSRETHPGYVGIFLDFVPTIIAMFERGVPVKQIAERLQISRVAGGLRYDLKPANVRYILKREGIIKRKAKP